MNIRIRASQSVVSDAEFRALFPNVALPRPLTDEVLADFEADFVYPISPQSMFGYVPVEGAPEFVNSRWQQTWAQELRPLAEIKFDLRAANFAKRIATEQAGVLYTFPDGQGLAQTRDANDKVNINGIVTNALLLKAAGVTDPVVPFRDAANVWHPMTPDQAITFGAAVASAILGIAEMKDEVDALIDALTTAEEAAAFDLEAAWTE